MSWRSAARATTRDRPSSPSLQRPDATEWAAELQRRLQHLGYYQGNEDGWFGPASEEALKAFQRDRGLTDDATATPEVWQKLDDEAVYRGYDPYGQQPSQEQGQEPGQARSAGPRSSACSD